MYISNVLTFVTVSNRKKRLRICCLNFKNELSLLNEKKLN